MRGLFVCGQNGVVALLCTFGLLLLFFRVMKNATPSTMAEAVVRVIFDICLSAALQSTLHDILKLISVY
jgi:hypothetical protein